MRKKLIISMMIYGLSSAMSFANVLNDSTQNEETFVASTSAEDDAWIKIKDGEEEQAYKDFLTKYPNSQYAEQAASVVALYDAVRLYEQEKYEEASKEFSKAMVYNTLSKEMMEKYDTCIHAVKYKDVGNGAEYTSREYLQEFPNGMYATDASNNIARKMADGFDKYSYSDASAYAKDFSTYQYVKHKSNAFAIRKSNYSTDRESTLKWALDDTTKSYVENHISANERDKRKEDRKHARANAWDDFWENKVAIGLEFLLQDYGAPAIYGPGLGCTLRFGRYDGHNYDPTSSIAFILGAKYQYINDHTLIGMGKLRWNFADVDKGALHFDIGGEYFYNLTEQNNDDIYISTQFGYGYQNGEVGLYYKPRIYNNGFTPFSDSFRIGITMIVYFMLS